MPKPAARSPRSISGADHHRRRRRTAGAIAAAVAVLFVAIVATSVGADGTWDPPALQQGAISELPKLRLEAQAQKAAAVLERQKEQRAAENAAIDETLAREPYVTTAGEQSRRVALTFDDGPSPYTDGILDSLKRAKAKATFFVLGNQIAEHPLPLQRLVAEGHAVANHSWSHADLTKLSARDVREELDRTSDALEAVGVPRPRLFRPPYGAYNENTLSVAGREKLLTTLWSIDTSDYQATDPNAVAQQVLSQIRPGAIVLMHDGGGNRTVTSQALPLILRGLREQDYETVTLPELLKQNPAPSPTEDVGRSEVA